MSLWLIMIILHTVSGVVCFASGLAILSLKRLKKYPWLLSVFIGSLVGLVVFMVAAMASHWSAISTLERWIFSGLVVLGLYMLLRAEQAGHAVKREKIDYEAYIGHIGFGLISLFNGFIIVGLIDLGAPAVVVVAGAVAASIAGQQSLKKLKRRQSSLHTE